ncbi:MAG: hypothetical protein M1470_07795 [Bacteroidetes bacterium]|nr:hypothetical protein [Bacteroidota bacterium]MCL5738607.1 hypothetical protein [Bacteroidota bacterium]
MERRKRFAVSDLSRVGFSALPDRFEFTPKTLVVYNDRIGLFVSERKGFGVSLYLPESLRSNAGLCFVPGDVHSNLKRAFDGVRRMLQRHNSSILNAQIFFNDSILSVSDINESTPISQDAIIHDGQIAIKIFPIGVQSVFVLDDFETAYGSAPIGYVVEKKEWAETFNNIAATWECLSKSFPLGTGLSSETPNPT